MPQTGGRQGCRSSKEKDAKAGQGQSQGLRPWGEPEWPGLVTAGTFTVVNALRE